MKTKIEIGGPCLKYSSPYGIVTSTYEEWYVSRPLTQQELNNPKTSKIRKILKSVSLGVIVRFEHNKHRYIINQLYPCVSFNSLKKAVNFLVKNEGKLVFCSLQTQNNVLGYTHKQ